jgi:hypothetical protein
VRLERTLVALSAVAGFSEEARAARLARHLAEREVATLARLVERAKLAEGAGADALRLAVSADRTLARQTEELTSALKLLARVEDKLGGQIGPEAAAGLRHLLENSRWGLERTTRIVDRLSAGEAEGFLQALRKVEARQFRRWGPEAFEALAQRPRSVRFLNEVGGEIFETTSRRAGNWQNLERLADGLELRKAELGDPVSYRRFLDRLGRDEAKAFDELLAARLRKITATGPSAQSGTLIAHSVGDSGEALARLPFDSQRSIRVAADASPELTRDAILAPPDGLEGALARLDESLTRASMPKEEVEKTLQAARDLNGEQRIVAHRQQVREMFLRTQALADARKFERTVSERIELLEKLAKESEQTNPERAARLRRQTERLRERRAEAAHMVNNLEALHDAVKGNEYLLTIVQGGEEELRRLWIQYWTRRTTPKSQFPQYVEHIVKRHYVGTLGEYEVAFRKSEELILLKAPDGLVTIPGTDLVAIERKTGDVLLIDNKALHDQAAVTKVDALTRNVRQNVRSDLNAFAKASQDGKLPSEVNDAITRLGRARDQIEREFGHMTREEFERADHQRRVGEIFREHGVRRVVTNAAGDVPAVSRELEEIGFEFEDLTL